MAAREEDIIRRYFEAFNKHDLEAVMSSFIPSLCSPERWAWADYPLADPAGILISITIFVLVLAVEPST